MKKIIIITLFLGLTGITHSAERPKINQWKNFITLPIAGIRTLFSSPTSPEEERVAYQVRENVIFSLSCAGIGLVITNGIAMTCNNLVSNKNEEDPAIKLFAQALGSLAGGIISYRLATIIEEEVNGKKSNNASQERTDKEDIFGGIFMSTYLPGFIRSIPTIPFATPIIDMTSCLCAYKSLFAAGRFANKSLNKNKENNSDENNSDIDDIIARGELLES